jgi:hypothetical protein
MPLTISVLFCSCNGCRSSRASTPAPGGQLTEEEKAQEQHEELREKLRIVRTVLEQGGTFAGINRKVQLKPTKWSAPGPSNAGSTKANTGSTPKPPGLHVETAPASEQQQAAAEQPPQQQQQQPGQQASKLHLAEGQRSARTSSTGGAGESKPPSGPAESKPQVTELLLILKYGGVLTHAGRAQAEELGKTFRMVMYPRCGAVGWVGVRMHCFMSRHPACLSWVHC